jgi:tetratricopeptide (TPR) repeat protein
VALAGAADPWAWLSLLAIVAILAVALARYRSDRLVFWSVGFLGIALLPTSNLVVLIGAPMAERFLYLPAVAFAILVAALFDRMKNQQYARVALLAILTIYAVRTFARNPDWNDNLSLAMADIPHSPRNFRLHGMLADALYHLDSQHRDARATIDRAIEEEQLAWEQLAAIPARQSSSLVPTALGVYYNAKADFVPPAEQTAWHEKALAILLKAREISRAIEQDYDAIQMARGGQPVSRAANQELYVTLANVNLHLDHSQDAVEALRYARGINPRTLEVYDSLSLAYSILDDLPMAVASLEEKALVDNFQPATMNAIRELYVKVADGQCAFTQRGARWEFNLAGCPRVKGDVCLAFAELAQAYRDSRSPDDAQQVLAAATQRYGCPR